ncbi:hypothetical protein LTR53_004419 [Teratosphaeriaceae sp. CCFEE 6253]|nr:hypothetical protein LTR53_004419 [Teratosphaeriaceae sp. CCFEE 6253]
MKNNPHILLQLLQALRHLHDRGVVHRDLKPANILLDRDFHIIISDLGLSKHAADKLFTTFCGTMGAIAPEVFPAARAVMEKYGPKADVWSAAVIVAKLYLPRLPSYPDSEPYRRRGKLKDQWHLWNDEWNELLLDQLWEDTDDGDQVAYLLSRMLRSKPQQRLSAEECLEAGCKNGLFARSVEGVYVVAAAGHERTSRSGLQKSGGTSSQQSQATVLPPSQQSHLSGSLWDSTKPASPAGSTRELRSSLRRREDNELDVLEPGHALGRLRTRKASTSPAPGQDLPKLRSGSERRKHDELPLESYEQRVYLLLEEG